MFNNGKHNGFHMTFQNGWTISVQWGVGNYCDRQTQDVLFSTEHFASSPNAEIAMWDRNGNWYNFGADTVKGRVTPDEVAEWMNKIRSWPDIVIRRAADVSTGARLAHDSHD